MLTRSRQVTRLITTRYWIALGLIALFVTASYLVLLEVMETKRDGIRIVRLAAEQQVSSQRICFLAHALVDATDAEDRQYYRSTLRRAIRQMKARHEILSLSATPRRLPSGMREILHGIYFEGMNPFNVEVDRFIENAQLVAETDDSKLHDRLPPLLKVNYAGSRSIMQTHKLIFGLLEGYGDRAVNRILWLGAIIWFLTLVLLALEVPLIFRPMVRRAARSLGLMELARRRAQREAAAAHAAREGQAGFLRTMSHELRTPLNAILGMSQLLQTNRFPEKYAEYGRDIHQAGQHLLGLINDILEFSRLEAKQVSIEKVQTFLAEELKRTISLLRPLAYEKRLALSWRIDDNLARYYRADGPRIRQVLVNLAGNAVKFTPRGTVALRALYAGPAGASADLVRFEVEDTGIGVPVTLHQRIFEEFQQADNSLTRSYGGSGLGLAISSRLVHLMDGEIGVESTEGQGSLFWFTLPLERMTVPDSQSQGWEPSLDKLRKAG